MGGGWGEKVPRILLAKFGNVWIPISECPPRKGSWCWVFDGETVWMDKWLGSSWWGEPRWPAVLGEPEQFVEMPAQA